MRAAFMVVAILLGLVVSSSPASAAGLVWGPELAADACGGGTLIISVQQDVVNDIDSGFHGNWAYDAFHRQIQVWQTGTNTFCATVNYEGSFVTIQGSSPGEGTAGGASLAAGITGTMHGGYRTTQFTATLNPAPSWPTRGSVGFYDYACTVDGTCTGAVSWLDRYFTGVAGWGQPWWGWIYRAGEHGTWVNASTGSSGDIR